MDKRKITAIAICYIIITIILCLIALPIIASINLFNFFVLSACECIFAYMCIRLSAEYKSAKRIERKSGNNSDEIPKSINPE